MSDAVLTVLKFCLLALLYLFLARVVWIVAKELRGTPEPAPVPPRAATPPPAKPARAREWRLVVSEPKAERGQSFTITADATIGRGGGCTVPITFDTFASQVHAKASPRDGDLWIEDIGSTNGTIVNGKRIEHPVKLRKGDKVKVGETLFTVDR
jgi:pSer/pThr/pTyr-binding forkhead associated (FHA) protein